MMRITFIVCFLIAFTEGQCVGGCADLSVSVSTIPGSTNGLANVTYGGGVTGCRTGTATINCTDPSGQRQAIIYATIPTMGTIPYAMTNQAEVICVNGQYQIGLVGDAVGQTVPFTSVQCSLA